MEEKEFKQFAIPLVIGLLLVMTYVLIKPIFIPIVMGLILAYVLYPLYSRLDLKINSKNWSATLIVLASFFLFVVPLLLLVYASTRQILNVYLLLKNFDFGQLLTSLIPSLFANPTVSSEIIATVSHLNTQITGAIITFFQNTIMNLPSIAMGIIIFLFTFFFGLVEGENVRNYLSVIFPFPKEHAEKFYIKFNQVTNSFIYGQVVVGFIQGIVAGIAYFMFGVPNAFLLTIVTIVASILPVIGPSLVWVPVDIFLFAEGNNVAGIQLLIYGLFLINWIHVILTPRIISKRAEMNPAIALIGMIGGLYAFGIIGLILGPLTLAYLILLIEIYRDKKTDSILIKENSVKTQ